MTWLVMYIVFVLANVVVLAWPTNPPGASQSRVKTFVIAKTICLFLLFVLAAAFLGEIAIILGYLAVACRVMTVFKRPIAYWVVGISVLAVLLHAFGFKLFGKPVLANLQSLENPQQVTALEPPGTLLLANGKRAEVADVFFLRSINLMEGTTNNYGRFEDSAGLHRQLWWSPAEKADVEVEIMPTGTGYAHVTCLRQAQYGCGNTWFANFFPRRLPRHTREDFRLVVLRAGLALPSSNYVMRAKPFWDPLIKATLSANYRVLPLRNTNAMAVAGAFLARNEFLIGAEMLIEMQATNSYPRLKQMIRQASKTPILGDLFLDSIDRNAVAPLFMRIDREEARKALQTAMSDPHAIDSTCWQPVCALAEQGSLEGYDALIEKMAEGEMDAEPRKILLKWTMMTFNFVSITAMPDNPDDLAKAFFKWYRELRPRLVWKCESDGRKGFALKDSDIFDDRYMATIRPYLGASTNANE